MIMLSRREDRVRGAYAFQGSGTSPTEALVMIRREGEKPDVI